MFRPLSTMFILTVLLAWVPMMAQEPPASKPSEEPKPASAAPDQSEPKQEGPQMADPVTSPPQTPGRRPNRGMLPAGFGHDEAVNRRLAAMVRLRDQLLDELTLSAEQKKNIDRLFDDYMFGLMKPSGPKALPPPDNFALPREIPELRARLEEAKKAGDASAAKEITGKITYAMMPVMPSVTDPIKFFLDYLISEVPEDQRERTNAIFQRWTNLRVNEVAPDNPFKQLFRASRDPDLKRTDEQIKKINEILREANKSVSIELRNDADTMTELARKTRPKISEVLDEKQRSQFEKTVDSLHRWSQEEKEVAKMTRERLANHQPAPIPLGAAPTDLPLPPIGPGNP